MCIWPIDDSRRYQVNCATTKEDAMSQHLLQCTDELHTSAAMAQVACCIRLLAHQDFRPGNSHVQTVMLKALIHLAMQAAGDGRRVRITRGQPINLPQPTPAEQAAAMPAPRQQTASLPQAQSLGLASTSGIAWRSIWSLSHLCSQVFVVIHEHAVHHSAAKAFV